MNRSNDKRERLLAELMKLQMQRSRAAAMMVATKTPSHRRRRPIYCANCWSGGRPGPSHDQRPGQRSRSLRASSRRAAGRVSFAPYIARGIASWRGRKASCASRPRAAGWVAHRGGSPWKSSRASYSGTNATTLAALANTYEATKRYQDAIAAPRLPRQSSGSGAQGLRHFSRISGDAACLPSIADTTRSAVICGRTNFALFSRN